MRVLLARRFALKRRANGFGRTNEIFIGDVRRRTRTSVPRINKLNGTHRGGQWAKDLRQALIELQAFKPAAPEDRIIFSERDIGISPKALAIWFLTLYRDLGFKGASSHSGRRTFITKAAKRCVEGGGSCDVQQLAGHSSLATTQRYIEGSSDAI
jgi:integrase